MKYIGLGLVLLVAVAIVGCRAVTDAAESNAYGKAIPADMAVTRAKDLQSNPAAFEGKDVLVSGKVASECHPGGWLWVKDETGDVYVNMRPAHAFTQVRVGKPVRIMGRVVLAHGEPQIVGHGLELRDSRTCGL